MSHWSKSWATFLFSATGPAASDHVDESASKHTTSLSSKLGKVKDVHGGKRRRTTSVLPGDISSVILLERIKEGHREALETLYKALFSELWGIAVIRTRSADRAEDIIQSVFLKFWERRDQLDPYIDVRVYLATAVRNLTRDIQKHDRVVGTAERAIADALRDLPGIGERPALPDIQFEQQEFLEAYQQAISTLTEQEKIAVNMRWERDMTFEQIGDILSISRVGARKVVLRAQRKIQRLLAQYRD